MKIQTFITIILCCFFISSCDDNEAGGLNKNTQMDLSPPGIGCIVTYAIEEGTGDTINRVFGSKRLKHGRWVTYALAPDDKKWSSNSTSLRKIVTETGSYNYDRRVGVWRSFNQDGSAKDSIDYRDSTIAGR